MSQFLNSLLILLFHIKGNSDSHDTVPWCGVDGFTNIEQHHETFT